MDTPATEPFVVRKSVTIHATPLEVWEALTRPDLTKRYFFGWRVDSDWTPGSPISFKRKILWKKVEFKGEVLEVHPQRLLRYLLKNTKGPDDPANQSIITDELHPCEEGTVLSVTDDVGSAEGAEKRLKKSEKAWDKVLHGLKTFLEEPRPHSRFY